MLTHKMCSLTIFAYGQSNKILWSTTMKNKNQREKEREKKNLQKTKMSKLIMKYRHKLIICTRENEA